LIAERYKPQLSVGDIEEILGIEKYDEEIAEKTRYSIRFSLSIFRRHCVTHGVSNRVRCKIRETGISHNILQKKILLIIYAVAPVS
jgi:hypothetical protein